MQRLSSIRNSPNLSKLVRSTLVYSFLRPWLWPLILLIQSWRPKLRKLFRRNATPQEGVVTGRYYQRSGYCNGCGHCCQDIHLMHDEKVVADLEAFEQLKQLHPEYEAFVPTGRSKHGLSFDCMHLQPDNTCGNYEDRPDFCRNYPNEVGLLLGAKLPSECSYQFELLKRFDEVLAEKKLKEARKKAG